MLRKQIVIHILKPQFSQIFDEKNCRSSGIALAKRVYLPQIRDKMCDVFYNFVLAQPFITEFLLLLKIIFQSLFQAVGTGIQHRFAIEHPLFFGDVVGFVLQMDRFPRKVGDE